MSRQNQLRNIALHLVDTGVRMPASSAEDADQVTLDLNKWAKDNSMEFRMCASHHGGRFVSEAAGVRYQQKEVH